MVSMKSTGGTRNEAMTEARRRVFVVDDHPIVRRGLTQLIDGENDMMACGQGEDVFQSFDDIRNAKPDLVLLDVSLRNSDGLELLKRLKAWNRGLVVLMLSMHDESLYAERALRAGANGYVMKQEAPQVLLDAMRKVVDGEIYVSEKMRGTLLQRFVGGRKATGALPMDRLTDREMEIFRLIGTGLSVKEIAYRLGLSAKTVEAHREHLKQKLGLRSSAELLRFAIQNSPDDL